MLPSSSNFARAVPPLHDIADLNQLTKGDIEVMKEYKYFLRSYLEEIRGTREGMGFKQVSILSAAMFDYLFVHWVKIEIKIENLPISKC